MLATCGVHVSSLTDFMEVYMDILSINGLQLWGTHGYFPEENVLGAKFIVDVEVAYDMTEMCMNDDLDAGLSYVTLHGICKNVICNEEHKLIQRVAQRIAEDVRKEYPACEYVKVTVRKPFVGLRDILQDVAVTITR